MRSVTLLLPALALPALLIAGCDRQSPANEQANAAAANVAANVPTPDEATAPADNGVDVIGRLDRSHKGDAAPTVLFDDPNGVKLTLASFAGKPVLLNLWATWCGPCKIEMPALEKIAGEGKLPVVTVSQDLDGAKAVVPYFATKGFTALKPYLDPELGFSKVLDNPSLPTTILYDAQGREIWRMTGGMDWTSPTARELLAEASS